MVSGHQSEVQPSAAATASRLPGRATWVLYALIGILLFALCMDLVFYTGFYASDDLQYISGATELAETGRLSPITLGTIRLVLVLPLALVAKVTHHNLFAMVSLFVLFHLLGVAGTYWLGRLVHDPETGLLAAGLMAVCPLAVSNAPMILPDHAVTSLVLLATAALILAGQRISCASGSRWSVYKLCAIGGLVFALGVGAKITAIIMLPVFLVLMLFWVRRSPASVVLKSALWFAAAAMIVGGLLWWTFYLVSGLHSPFQDSKFVAILTPSPGRVTAADLTFLDRLAIIKRFALSDKYLGLFRWVLPVGLVVYPFLKRRSWAVYLTFVWLSVYMTWGTFSLTHYVPPPVNIRYFILALPFALIAVAFVAMSLTRPLWSRLHNIRFARIALVALGLVAGLLVVANSAARVNRLAGQLHHSPEVAGVRYALDYAAQSDKRPVVLSYWLSFRMDPVFLDSRYPRVILTKRDTALSDLQELIKANGFLYMDCAYETYPNHRSPGRASPLDLLVRQSLAGGETGLIARTLGRFGQFETRLSALQYVFGGSGRDMDLRRAKRAVFLRDITVSRLEAQELSDETAEALDLSQVGIWGPTWVHNVKACNISPESQGSLICEIAGSEASFSQYGGIRIKTGPITAISLAVTFQNPDEIAAAYMDLTVGTGTKNRLRWEYTPSDDRRMSEGRRTYTFRPDQRTGAFLYVGGPAALDEVDTAQFFIRLKGQNARAGFRIHQVLVER